MRSHYHVQPPTVGAPPLTERHNYISPEAFEFLPEQDYAYSVRPEIFEQKIGSLYAHYDDNQFQGWTAACRDATGRLTKCEGEFAEMSPAALEAYQRLRAQLAPPAPPPPSPEEIMEGYQVFPGGAAEAQRYAGEGYGNGADPVAATALGLAEEGFTQQEIVDELAGSFGGTKKSYRDVAKQARSAVSGRTVGQDFLGMPLFPEKWSWTTIVLGVAVVALAMGWLGGRGRGGFFGTTGARYGKKKKRGKKKSKGRRAKSSNGGRRKKGKKKKASRKR